VAFTSNADQFYLVLPGMDSSNWVKGLNLITVR